VSIWWRASVFAAEAEAARSAPPARVVIAAGRAVGLSTPSAAHLTGFAHHAVVRVVVAPVDRARLFFAVVVGRPRPAFCTIVPRTASVFRT